MALVCSNCGSADVQALADASQCLACGATFLFEADESLTAPPPQPVKKRGKK